MSNKGISDIDETILELVNNNNYLSRDLDDMHKAYRELLLVRNALQAKLDVAIQIIRHAEIMTFHYNADVNFYLVKALKKLEDK